ncbi:MAG: ATP-dependent Clp protease adaptor ClpS [Myxococcales bacterium]|nr:ATP-dependent Clp protease adaptor ClpS [Myxococcales bacterium]
MPKGEREWEQRGVEAEQVDEVSEPPMYRVLLHNDDFTTMEFVIFILENLFGHPSERAFEIMMHVHQRGVGVAGVFPFEVAEAKAKSATELARANEYPLLLTVEEA